MSLTETKYSTDDYDELKELLNKCEKTKRIFILFSGSKDSNGQSWSVQYRIDLIDLLRKSSHFDSIQ